MLRLRVNAHSRLTDTLAKRHRAYEHLVFRVVFPFWHAFVNVTRTRPRDVEHVLKAETFSTMRQHLSANGIRRNKINLPLGGNEVGCGKGGWGEEWETHDESAGRKEGRKEGKEEGRKRGMGKARHTHTYRIEDTHVCLFLSLSPACSLSLDQPPGFSSTLRRYPPGYENTPRFPSKKTRDIRRGVNRFARSNANGRRHANKTIRERV